MQKITSHTERAGALTVRLVNALASGWERGRRLDVRAPEEQVRRARDVTAHGQNPSIDRSEGALLAGAAADLHRVFAEADRGHLDAACQGLNQVLERFPPSPILLQRGDGRWELHFHTAVGGVGGWVAGAAAALAQVLGSPEWPRLGVCSATRCDRVFLDRSRNAGRRFCSAACQSRTKAAAFRARRPPARQVSDVFH